MDEKKIRVAITHGDTNGIGYEQIFKTFASPEMLELCTPIIYGSPKIASYHRKALNIPGNFSIISSCNDIREGRVNMLTCFDEDVKVDFGTFNPDAQKAGVKALERALADFQNNGFDVLVTAPLNKKESLFPGNAAFFQKKIGNSVQPLTILVGDGMRLALVTEDIAFKDIAEKISTESIVEKAVLLNKSLKRDFRIFSPRIAILALNPNGDGKEESEIISPAIAKLESEGIQAFGPFVANEFFGNNKQEAFDVVLAMYHDQGITPFKTLSANNSYVLTTGLPVVHTAPDCDPSYAIAGKNEADESKLRQAIYAAIDIFRNRINFDEPFANPLPKLYHEKRDESEKVRFSIPKKHENSIKEKL